MLLEEVKHSDWFDVLSPFNSHLSLIDSALAKEADAGVVHYPAVGLRLAALRKTAPSTVRCVIVGQDPYPGTYEGDTPFAMGLAFSVPEGAPLPASLKNIDKELARSGCGSLKGQGDLSSWASQGVLLLNAVMTLKAGESNSHSRLGWQAVTRHILLTVMAENEHAVFLGFGRHAHKLYDDIGVPPDRQIKTSHPSPLGATKNAKNGEFKAFLGSGCFNEVNHRLVQSGLVPIVWGREIV